MLKKIVFKNKQKLKGKKVGDNASVNNKYLSVNWRKQWGDFLINSFAGEKDHDECQFINYEPGVCEGSTDKTRAGK